MGKASFGRVVFKGTEYRHDIVVCNGEVKQRRKEISLHLRRKYGHTPLTGKEIMEYLKGCGEVQVLFIGTGVYGALPLTEDAEEVIGELSRKGVEVIREVTSDELLSRVEKEKRKYLAIIHTTC